MRCVLVLVALLLGLPAPVPAADKARYLDLARRGWSYQLRTTMIGRDLSIPVRINGQAMAGTALCILGERPHPQTAEVLSAFSALMQHSFGRSLPMRYAGATADACGSGRTVLLRLYSGEPPHEALSSDLAWMDAAYDLGLPRGRAYFAAYPGMAQTFFGRRGQGTHIMVEQPSSAAMQPLEATFFRSVLIEELFQAYSFGIDILIFDRRQEFLSKLQETPLDPRRYDAPSRAFMEALVVSNPRGLCSFDVFMLHAVAAAPVHQTIEPGFIDFIDSHFDEIQALAGETLRDPSLAPLLDQLCLDPA